MDRTTIRIILLIIGALAIAGVYLWHQHRARIRAWWSGLFRGHSFANDFGGGSGDFGDTDGAASFHDYVDDYELSSARVVEPQSAAVKRTASVASARPTLIQLSVVATEDGYFAGEDLLEAFKYVGLSYGDRGIFHRFDEDHGVLYSVASIVEPGTFPVNNMAGFVCPGVVLFFQTSQVASPLETFDSLVSCCHELAIRLNGVEWDAERQPLTTEKIAALRYALS